MADEDLERREGCYKLLLDAGSDISSTHSFGSGEARYWMSAYSKELASGTLVRLFPLLPSIFKVAHHIQTNVKALLDLGEPFISLESTGDDMPYESTTPLLLLAGFHAWYYYLSPLTPAKIAFLLRRGANAKARNPGGETCLHRVLRHNHRAKDCWCEISSRTWRYLYQTKDILILMISAGADVCAIDKQGRSVSDVINHPGLETVWTEALKYCGIDIRDVVARPNLDPAHSTALDYQYREPLRSVTSKISLAEYLKRRNPAPERFKAARELSSSEEDESEDEVSVRDSGNLTEARQNKSITEDEEIDGSYEDIGARKKTKLE